MTQSSKAQRKQTASMTQPLFQKVLIANRGEIALRIIRSCKEMGIATVAVHSEADEDALFVKLADESVCIGPARANESYLLPQRILSAAEITGADAIHPGYGFLSENAEFARKVTSCGFTFIGPSAENIELMGDKLASREVMEKNGLTLLPSATITQNDLNRAKEALDRIGLPLIIKASAGGGGKGIKIVRSKETFLQTLQTAQAEAKAAFGDDRVYLERYLEKARHIEFQIAADQHGNVIHLGERDCSIQRRYQKVIEETPSPAVSRELRDEIGEKVVQAVAKLGYQSVGTVEFLMDADKNFYFLEMNTRIQVEHPITEEVTNIDLVKLQIKLAAGVPMPIKQEDVHFVGHAIEFRINAEDPEKFSPSCGEITELHLPGGKGVRIDSGIYSGLKITPYYDSMLAKLIIHGETRAEALRKAGASLHEFQLEGIQTNIPLHQRIIVNKSFRDGDYHTHFLNNFLSNQVK